MGLFKKKKQIEYTDFVAHYHDAYKDGDLLRLPYYKNGKIIWITRAKAEKMSLYDCALCGADLFDKMQADDFYDHVAEKFDDLMVVLPWNLCGKCAAKLFDESLVGVWTGW